MSPMRDVHGIDGAEDDPKHGDASDDEGTLEEGPGGEDDGEAADDEGSGDGPTAEPEEPQVHEVSPERPRRRRHGKGRRRHRRRGRPEEEPKPNKKMYAIVIGLVVIVPLIGAAWFFFGPAGSIRKIDLIARPYVGSDKVSGIQLAAIIDTGKPSSVSGSADVKISHDGAGVYSGRLDVSESQAQRNLPLNQFAVGNGDYRVELSFQGTTTSTVFTLTEIIEWMNVTAFNLTQLNNATLVPAGTARIGFTVTFLSNAEAAQIAAENDRLEVEIIKGGVSEKHTETVGARPQINKNYPVSGNGNYTVRATFFSSKVKPGSQYSRIEATANDSFTKRPYVQVSIPPTAVPRSDKTTAQWKLADGGAVFKFDATGSIAYEGATFWNYTWDFGDDEWSIEAKATHTYTKVPSADQPLRYIVTLTVVDSNEQSASAQIQVTVTL